MKTKFFTLFAAFALLFGAKAMAQTNGDVNGDGKVDEQDITAIIQIMQEAGGVKEQTKYYWYVGQENPASITSISPIVTDNTSPGWRYLGSDLSVYNSTNKMWAGAIEPTITFSARDVYYIALPNSSAKVYDDTGYGGVLTDAFSTPTTKDINGVKYYIYTFTAGKSKAFNGDIY